MLLLFKGSIPMGKNYADVLERLKEERNQRKWSQNDMSRHVHMSQGNYSKIEMGKRRLSYEELKYLCGSGVNVHYVFTGQKGDLQIDEFLRQYNYSELVCLLDLILSLITYYFVREKLQMWKEMYYELKYLRMITVNGKSDSNLFFLIRRASNYQQWKMAELLGVDIKKLRDLENERCLPDSELIWRIYNHFNIPPALVLDDYECLICQISCLLKQLDIDGRKQVLEIVKIL